MTLRAEKVLDTKTKIALLSDMIKQWWQKIPTHNRSHISILPRVTACGRGLMWRLDAVVGRTEESCGGALSVLTSICTHQPPASRHGLHPIQLLLHTRKYLIHSLCLDTRGPAGKKSWGECWLYLCSITIYLMINSNPLGDKFTTICVDGCWSYPKVVQSLANFWKVLRWWLTWKTFLFPG